MVKAHKALNPSHACHSADVLTPVERAAERHFWRPIKPATTKLGDIPTIKETFMNAIAPGTPLEDCENAISGLTVMERDVLECVPSSDSWTAEVILSDSCVQKRMVRDIETMRRCLSSLMKLQLVREVTRGKFRKTKVAVDYLSKKMASSIVGNSSLMEAPQLIEQPEALISDNANASRLRRQAEQLRQEATRLQAMANSLDEIAAEMSDTSEKLGKLDQLRDLLKQIAV